MKYRRFFFCFGIGMAIFAILSLYSLLQPLNKGKNGVNDLSGYRVIFHGETNVLSNASFVGIPFRRHPMSKYLDMAAPYIQSVGWPRTLPIRIEEDTSHVMVILPGSCEINGISDPRVFSSGYSLKVVIDKKTMLVIEAVSG